MTKNSTNKKNNLTIKKKSKNKSKEIALDNNENNNKNNNEIIVQKDEIKKDDMSKTIWKFINNKYNKLFFGLLRVDSNTNNMIFKWILVGSKLCVGGFLCWGALKSIDAITGGFGVPDIVFDYIQPLTVPKIFLKFVIMPPLKLLTWFIHPSHARLTPVLNEASQQCIEHARTISMNIVNPKQSLLTLSWKLKKEIKAIIKHINPTFFSYIFSKILSDENCIYATDPSSFMELARSAKVDENILFIALEKFKEMNLINRIIYMIMPESTSITQIQLSDFFN